MPGTRNALLSPEARLLLLAAGDPPSQDVVVDHLNDPGLDWNRFVALAEKEKATAITWSLLRPHAEAIPPERARQMGMLSMVSDFRMQHHAKLLAGVIDVLNDIDVPVVLLKGAALAVTAYGSFKLRPMYDLDLLVRPEDGERAWNALRQNGWLHEEEKCPTAFYADHYHLPPLDDPGGTGLAVELHTRPWEDGVRLDEKELWEAARIIEWEGRQTRVPSLTHQILHLSTHFAWGHMLRSGAWRTARDLGTLIRSEEVDWEEVIAAARNSGGSACCFWTFEIARCTANVAIPTTVLDALRPPIPAFAIDLLRRHYIGTLFGFSPAPCPSVRLERFLWSAGHAPERTGLGIHRPWERSEGWISHDTKKASLSVGAKMKAHFMGLQGWARYIRMVAASSR